MLGNESMKKPQNPLFSAKDIAALAASQAPLENFGPQSDNPSLVFDLSGSDPALLPWLKELPCPIIGIGKGALSEGCDVVLDTPQKLSKLTRNIEQAPLAAMILVQHLRASEQLSHEDALAAESFAYATIQNGPEFQSWRLGFNGKPLPKSPSPHMIIERDNSALALMFNRPDTRNVIGIEMRDTLCEALDLAIMDDEITNVTLTGNGATFSTGGAIEEFGEVSDPATAHWIRSLRLPARRLAKLRHKLHIHVNGAAIGAGAEIAAFGKQVTASPKAWFQLPELKYGLIPGAGGTASITRRIGRQKTAYMALSMDKINTQTALEWGLIDAIID